MLRQILILMFFASPLYGQEFLIGSVNDFNFGKFYNYIHEHAPSEDAFVAVQRLAEPKIRSNDWEAARNIFIEYKSDFPGMEQRFDKIIDLLAKPIKGLDEINLGRGINSKGYEHSPMPTADGRYIYFTGLDRNFSNRSEDVYRGEYIDGKWKNARKIKAPFNTLHNEAPQCILTDGNLLVLYGNYPEKIGRGDIYYSQKTDTGWTYPKLYPPPINTEWFECDAKVNSTGNTMIFVSERPGGIGPTKLTQNYFHGARHGNTDIYVSVKQDTGWSEPINLGETINTPFAERKPYLHSDGKTLYFASDGHYGLGRLDLFVSRRLSEDSWTKWSEPINLGKEINGSGTDWGAVVSTDGEYAYFAATNREVNYGGTDIYSFELPDFAKPEKVVVIKGKVTDNEDNILAADIVWENLETTRKVGRLSSDPQTGDFIIVLPVGRNYGYYAEKEGYYPVSNNIDLRKSDTNMTVVENITMFEIDKIENEIVRINNLFFNFDDTRILPESIPELQRLEKLLKDHENFRIEISGHTCNKGPAEYNLDLSKRRAKAVKQYLIKNGIDAGRIRVKGYGQTKPIETNNTPEGRSENRRVEFRIFKTSEN